MRTEKPGGQNLLALEVAAASGNIWRLSQLIRATGSKKSGVSEIICEADGTPIINIQDRFKTMSRILPESVRLICCHSKFDQTVLTPLTDDD